MNKIIFKAKCGNIHLLHSNEEKDFEINEDLLPKLDGINSQDNFVDYSDMPDKLKSGYMHFRYENEILYTVTEYSLKEELTSEEIEKLKEETQGQWSDGIGEGFEQFPCHYIGEYEVYISPWYRGQIIETIIE